MRRISPADIDRMRENGYDPRIIAQADALLAKYPRADELMDHLCRGIARA
jgi:hypothetical protein